MLSNLWPFRRRARTALHPWDLDRELLRWGKHDGWRIRDAVEGCSIMGSTGSGKTSSSGRYIADSFLRAGFGGLVLTTKPDEKQLWSRYCAAAGRSDDLIVISPGGPHSFNFIDYELQRPGDGAGLTHNIANLLSSVAEIADRQSGGGGGGKSEEAYWQRSTQRKMRCAIDLQIMGQGHISVADLYRVATSAPTSLEQIRTAEWRKQSLCMQLLEQANRRVSTDMQQADFDLVSDFYLIEWPQLSEKTRSVILSCVTSMLDVLNRGILRQLLCTTTTITPDACLSGKILLIDLPLKLYNDVGALGQAVFKRSFQNAVERRSILEHTRPVFLWIDEAAGFVSSNDLMFQTTCRSSRCATVLLSQGISTYYAALGGGEKAKAEADGILGNLGTKIFHALSDPVSQTYAADIIGRIKQLMTSTSGTTSGHDYAYDLFMGNSAPQTTSGCHEAVEHEVLPSQFMKLRKGGPDNLMVADCYVVQNGRRFKGNGNKSWTPVSIPQRP